VARAAAPGQCRGRRAARSASRFPRAPSAAGPPSGWPAGGREPGRPRRGPPPPPRGGAARAPTAAAGGIPRGSCGRLASGQRPAGPDDRYHDPPPRRLLRPATPSKGPPD